MTKDEALHLALEELENCADLLKVFEAPIDSCVGATMLQAEAAITAIKQALEQPEERYTYGTPLLDVFTKPAPVQDLAEYDAGLMNDYGGGNVQWWQDYIRYELGCAYEHYKEQLTTPPAAQRQCEGDK